MEYNKVNLIFRYKNTKRLSYLPNWEYDAHPEYVDVILKTDYPCKIDEWTTSFKSPEKFFKSETFAIAHSLFIKGFPVTPSLKKDIVESQTHDFMKNGEIYYMEEGIKKEAIFTSQKEIENKIRDFAYSIVNVSYFYDLEQRMPKNYQSIFTEYEQSLLEGMEYLTFYYRAMENLFYRLKNSNRFYSLYRDIISEKDIRNIKITIPFEEITIDELEKEKKLTLKRIKKQYIPYKDNDFLDEEEN